MPKRKRETQWKESLRKAYKRRTMGSIPRAPPLSQSTQVAKTTKKHIMGTRTRKVTMRYSSTHLLDGTISPSAVVFRSNSMFDPEVAIGGTQPRGFDQLMALYDHFVVIGATITVYASCVNSDGSAIISIQNRDSATEALDRKGVIEYADKSTTILGGQNTEKVAIMSHSVNVGKFLGRNSVMSDPELKGSATGNPEEQSYFHIYAIHGSTDTEDPPPVFITTEIEYTAILIEPKLPGAS